MDNELKPNKDLGQHWLTDDTVLEAICKFAQVTSRDVVLEIGPGLGSLTEYLLAKAGRVVAVELDTSLSEYLLRQFKGHERIEIYNRDIRKFDLTTLPKGYKTVANIPYYLTSYLIRLLSQSTNPPSLAVLLIQQEVAARMTAKPGQLSVLGVLTQVYWQVDSGPVISPEKFTPSPKVNSQIIKLVRRPSPDLPRGLENQFFQTVKIGFSQKRKTLANSLSAGLRISKDDMRSYINQAGLNENIRAQELSIDDWHKLTEVIFTK